MGRPVYEQELSDPDFEWLLSSFKSSHPTFLIVQSGNTPVVLFEGALVKAPEKSLPVLGHQPEDQE